MENEHGNSCLFWQKNTFGLLFEKLPMKMNLHETDLLAQQPKLTTTLITIINKLKHYFTRRFEFCTGPFRTLTRIQLNICEVMWWLCTGLNRSKVSIVRYFAKKNSQILSNQDIPCQDWTLPLGPVQHILRKLNLDSLTAFKLMLCMEIAAVPLSGLNVILNHILDDFFWLFLHLLLPCN